jgi:hypothetical protein
LGFNIVVGGIIVERKGSNASVTAPHEYRIFFLDKNDYLGSRAFGRIHHGFDAFAYRHIPDSCNHVAIADKKTTHPINLNTEYPSGVSDSALLFKGGTIVHDDMARLSAVGQNDDTASSSKNSRCHDPLLNRKACQAVVPGAGGDSRHVKCFAFFATELLIDSGILGAEQWD